MSKTYNPYEHTHVVVQHPTMPESECSSDAWSGPMAIVLHTGAHVWVSTCYGAEGHPEVKRVGDGRDNGYDEAGNCIASVPAEWCSYFTEDEAHGIEQCIDADERLLRYAR